MENDEEIRELGKVEWEAYSACKQLLAMKPHISESDGKKLYLQIPEKRRKKVKHSHEHFKNLTFGMFSPIIVWPFIIFFDRDIFPSFSLLFSGKTSVGCW